MDKPYLSFEQWEPNHWQFSYRGEAQEADDDFGQGLELLEGGTPGKAAQKFRSALRRFPEHVGALHHLGCALKEQGRDLDAWAFFEMAVSLARSKVPVAFIWDEVVVSWYEGDNRAYMRACLQLAMELMERGFLERACGCLEHLLAVWPNDNLGVRYVVPECYLRMEAYDKVVAHASRHADDDSPYIIYSTPLALLKTERDSAARESMARAVALRPEVARELMKKEHTPPADMGRLGESPGGADEAYGYWQHMGSLWLSDAKALGLLRSIAAERGGSVG